MTTKELMKQYFVGELDAISLIRMLSGMFDPKHAVHWLTLICAITRHEQGDISTEDFNEVWKFGIDLKFNKGDYPEEYDTMPMESLKQELEKLKKDSEDGNRDQDISLLISYLIYRERKNKKEASEETSPQDE